jgi:hypothetical protein
MTEDEWNGCTDRAKMVFFLRGRGCASDRKLRLLAVACCRRIWESLGDERSRKAGEVAEQYADGLASREQLVQARDEAREARRRLITPRQPYAWRAASVALDAVRDTASSAVLNAMSEAARVCNQENHNNEFPPEQERQADLLKCIFGNPIRAKPAIDPAWLSWNAGTVRRLAEDIYARRAFEELGILADALEEAGCSDAELLGHLRGPGPHVRGCFAVDAILWR